MKQSIFTINIYKPEAKKKKSWKGPSEWLLTGLSYILSFLVLLGICVYLVFGLYIPQKRDIEASRSLLQGLEQRLEALRQTAKDLEVKRDFFLGIRGQAITWPEKLHSLSESVPDNIWLSKIEFPGRAGQLKGGQSLAISALTFSGFKEENLDQIGDLLDAVNQSEQFKDEFEPMHLDFTKKSEAETGIILLELTGKAKDLSK